MNHIDHLPPSIVVKGLKDILSSHPVDFCAHIVPKYSYLQYSEIVLNIGDLGLPRCLLITLGSPPLIIFYHLWNFLYTRCRELDLKDSCLHPYVYHLHISSSFLSSSPFPFVV